MNHNKNSSGEKSYSWRDDKLTVGLLVQTRASKNDIIGWHNGRLKIAITAPPVDDKANKLLIKFLSKYFSVPQNHIQITSGLKSKNKSLIIISPKNNLRWFEETL